MANLEHSARAARVTWGTAWRESVANKGGFWSQIIIMFVNDAVWILFWLLVFRRVDDLRGWDFDLIVLLYAVFTTAGGLILGMANNVRRIGELASTGGLDAALALPTPTLLHLLTRRIEPINLGDFVFGVGLFLALGNPTPTRAAIFIVGVACSTLVWGGFLVLVGSLGFFTGRQEPGDLGFQALIMFSSYPIDLFAGGFRILLYGVVPAAFVTSVPAKLIADFDLAWALALIAASALVATLGAVVFHAGLRRYTSGATWVNA